MDVASCFYVKNSKPLQQQCLEKEHFIYKVLLLIRQIEHTFSNVSKVICGIGNPILLYLMSAIFALILYIKTKYITALLLYQFFNNTQLYFQVIKYNLHALRKHKHTRPGFGPEGKYCIQF